MSRGTVTLTSRDRVAQSDVQVALLDLEDLPSQYAIAEVLRAWEKAVRCCAAHALAGAPCDHPG
jgi:hypothetical protein